MGRGNWIPSRTDDLINYGGYYIDNSRFLKKKPVGSNEIEYDDIEYNFFIEMLIEHLWMKYGELRTVNSYIKNDELVLLEDGEIKLIVADNEWSTAIYLIQEKSENYDKEGEPVFDKEYDTLMNEKFCDYLEYLKITLKKLAPDHVHYRTGSWTSGKVD